MELGLRGKRALVLASSSGLGRAIAKRLAFEGAEVALCSRSQVRAEASAASIREETSGHVLAFEVDVSSSASLEELFRQVAESYGGIDLLVCNAGGPPAGNFEAVEECAWSSAFNLTLMSVARSIKLALPYFKAAGGGSILALGSSSVKQPIPNLLLSNVFRPAVHGLVKHLADELASYNIRINMLSPGRILTNRTAELDVARAKRESKSVDQVRAESVAQIPLGRLGEPEEFAKVAVFLLSRAASYVTGSSVFVDGGMIRGL